RPCGWPARRVITSPAQPSRSMGAFHRRCFEAPSGAVHRFAGVSEHPRNDEFKVGLQMAPQALRSLSCLRHGITEDSNVLRNSTWRCWSREGADPFFLPPIVPAVSVT